MRDQEHHLENCITHLVHSCHECTKCVIQFSRWCSWWWTYSTSETRRAKQGKIKINCKKLCILLVYLHKTSVCHLTYINGEAPSSITWVLLNKYSQSKLFIYFPNLPLNLKQGFCSKMLRNENRVAMAICECNFKLRVHDNLCFSYGTVR